MKRRTVMTAMGASVATGLTACGGGEGDVEIGEISPLPGQDVFRSEPSRLQALTEAALPTQVVNKNGQYQLEVVYQTTRAITISFSRNGGTRSTIMSKVKTVSATHTLDYAMFRCTTSTGYTCKNFAFSVFENGVGNPISVGAGKIPVAGSVAYRAIKNTNGEIIAEYWDFYSTKDSAWLATLKFFPLTSGESYTFPTGKYIDVIKNSAVHNGLGNRTIDYPMADDDFETVPEVRSLGVVTDTTNTTSPRDSICIPDFERADHFYMVPVLLSITDAAERAIVKRTFIRFFEQSSTLMYEVHGRRLTGSDMIPVHGEIQSNILRMIGGSTLTKYINRFMRYAFESARTEVKDYGSDLEAYMKKKAQDLIDALEADGRKLSDISGLDSDSIFGFGTTATVSIQGEGSMNVTNNIPFLNWVSGGGIQLSFPVYRRSKRLAWGDEIETAVINSSYKPGGEYFKSVVTAIVKGFDGIKCRIGDLSIDIEVNFPMTCKSGVGLRLDAIIIDPVFDFDTKSFAYDCISAVWKYMRKGTATSTAVSRLNNMTGPLDVLAGDMDVAEVAYFTRGMSVVSGIMLLKGVAFVINQVIERANSPLSNWNTNWSIFEISPLTFSIISENTAPGRTFKKGGLPDSVAVGWTPSVKLFGGKGLKFGSTDSLFKGYVRAVGVVEFAMAAGSTDFKNAFFGIPKY